MVPPPSAGMHHSGLTDPLPPSRSISSQPLSIIPLSVRISKRTQPYHLLPALRSYASYHLTPTHSHFKMPPDRKTESTPAVAPIGKIDLDVRRMNGQQLRSEIMKDRKEMKQLREELAKPGKHREEQLEDLRTRLADYSKRANTDTLLGWHFFLGDRTEEGIVLADLLRVSAHCWQPWLRG